MCTKLVKECDLNECIYNSVRMLNKGPSEFFFPRFLQNYMYNVLPKPNGVYLRIINTIGAFTRDFCRILLKCKIDIVKLKHQTDPLYNIQVLV